MAASAETLQLEAEVPLQSTYLPADLVPELYAARNQAKVEAYQIIENNRQLLLAGDFESSPIDVDALGTAKKVVTASQTYGPNSWQYQDCRAGLVLDCRRLYAEAVRKNTYEYFPLVRQEFDHQNSEYISHGQSILNMTELGLSPIVEQEETERRVNERVEEVTYRTIGQLGLSKTVSLMTISECTDWAVEVHQRDSKGGSGGYVPEIEKLMIRNVSFDPISKDRYEEQVGLPGTFISHEVVVEALSRRGVLGPNSKTEVHATQLIHEEDIFDFVALLDQIASQKSGLEIYMGEPLKPGQARSYSEIRNQAMERQDKLEEEAENLSNFILELETNQTDRWLAVKLVENEVKNNLLRMAGRDLTKAAVMFDEPTARGLREVAYLRSVGRVEEAQVLFAQVEAQAPTPSYCGAGSCGLESIKPGSKEADAMEKMGLNSANSLKDTERKCKACGEQKVVYDLKNKKKGCTGCGATKKY